MAAARATNDNRVRLRRQAFVTPYNNFAGLGDISRAKHSQLLVRTVDMFCRRSLGAYTCTHRSEIRMSLLQVPACGFQLSRDDMAHASPHTQLFFGSSYPNLGSAVCPGSATICIDANYRQTHAHEYSANLRGIIQAKPSAGLLISRSDNMCRMLQDLVCTAR